MKKVSKRHLSVVISLIKEKKSCEKLEKEKKDFGPIIAMPGNRSLVECRDPCRIQSSNYRSGRVYSRPRPSLAKCLFIRKKLPFSSSPPPPPPFFFGAVDREKEGVDREREREIVRLVERGRGTNEPIEKAPMQLT